MKVTDTKGLASINKTKKSGKSNKASGVSFDSLVQKAGEVEAAASVDSVGGVGSGGGSAGSYIPQEAEARGEYMLKQLEDLERDILSGKASGAVHRLKEALNTQALNRDELSDELIAILDEIEMRASVEVAKMETAKGNAED